MMENKYRLDRLRQRNLIFNSPLYQICYAYEDFLRELKYKENTIDVYLKSIIHFSHWLKITRKKIQDIGVGVSVEFEKHLRRCSCPQPVMRSKITFRAALILLQKVLLEQGLIEPATPAINPALVELERYEIYLKCIRGLAQNTRRDREKIITEFLYSCFDDEIYDLTTITPQCIDNFVLGYAKRWKPSSLVRVRSALRSYMRFRLLQGDDAESLIASMPTIASKTSSKPPDVLTSEELDHFFGSFDLTTGTGLRDFAIARCLNDLGLRGNEVARLMLDSFNWQEGVVTISGAKGGCTKELPLPPETGAAVAEYIRLARPRTSIRNIFIRQRGPVEKALTVDGIRGAMKYAFKRSGLSARHGNTHIFRHTLAFRLQKSGAGLKEIADVLRHKSIESTKIYAKIDMDALAKISLPWPGRTSNEQNV